MNRHGGDIPPGDRNSAGIRHHVTRDGREQCALAGAVAADQNREIAFVEGEIDAIQGTPFGRRAPIEGLEDARDTERRLIARRHFTTHFGQLALV